MTFKIAFLSDIHGNLQALQAVMADMEREGVGKVICLGDIVGYGANPVECLGLSRTFDDIVSGNHELALADARYRGTINQNARKGVEHALSVLTESHLETISRFPLGGRLGRIQYAHGSNTAHGLNRALKYTCSLAHNTVRRELLSLAPRSISVVGHSHYPEMHEMAIGDNLMQHYTNRKITQTRYRLKGSSKYVINVGSVGQPRDDCPKASYGIIHVSGNDHEFEPRSVSYDIDAAADAIRNAGLPEYLAKRLYCNRT